MGKQNYLLHILLFIITVATTTASGAELIHAKSIIPWTTDPKFWLSWDEFLDGFKYSIPFLLFLTTHEFGHFLTAVFYKVKASLPYYIPVYIPLPGMMNIGSFGAVIRLRQQADSTKKFFDIGVAGPLAGFVIAVGVLWYGFANLPDPDQYILDIHPEYIEQFGGVPTIEDFKAQKNEEMGGLPLIGSNLLYELMKHLIAEDPARVPPAFEVMHYPYLLVGFLGLFFTALNLLPIGQLDGGHVTYGLFGRKRAGDISRVAILLLLLIGSIGVLDFRTEHFDVIFPGIFLMAAIYVIHKLLKDVQWYVPVAAAVLILISGTVLTHIFTLTPSGLMWLLYSVLAVRVIGVDHPPAIYEHKLNMGRKVIGWICILIFILCFTPFPVSIVAV